MPLTPSSYKKIFKSKYVQDDSDEENVDGDNEVDYRPTISSSASTTVSSYTTPSTSTAYTSKIPKLTSAYLDSHPELDLTPTTSTFTSGLSSSYFDSRSKTTSNDKGYNQGYSSTFTRTSTTPSYTSNGTGYGQGYSSTYTRTSTTPSYTQGLTSPYLESRNFLTPERTSLSRLPPLPQRSTPSRRNFDEVAPFSHDNVSSRFQSRPLRDLTVVSRSITPVRSINRSPSPVDSVSWRSNKSVTPAPRRVFPQSSVSGSLDDLADKEEAPVIFDANLTFVLGCKGKVKQNFTPIPAHAEKDTASSCLTDKISDFLKRTDHVMEEWKGMGHKNDDNNNIRAKGMSITGKSKSATNIMIKGFQLFSKASSCSRSSLGKDLSEDCTEAEVDEVLSKSEPPCILSAN